MEIVIAIVGIGVGVICTVITMRFAHKDSEKALRFSKEASHRSFSLLLYGRETNRYIISAPLKPKRLLRMPLDFQLKNTSKLTLEDIEISIRIPKALCFNNMLPWQESGLSLKKLQCKSVNETEYIARTVLGVQYLHPDQVCGIRMELSLADFLSTWHKLEVPCTTKDDVRVIASCFVRLNWAIEIAINAKDCKSMSKTFMIGIFNSEDKSSLMDIFSEDNERLVREALKDKKRKYAFLYRQLYGEWEPYAIALVTEQDIVRDKSKTPIDYVAEADVSFGYQNVENGYINAEGVRQSVMPGDNGATFKFNLQQ